MVRTIPKKTTKTDKTPKKDDRTTNDSNLDDSQESEIDLSRLPKSKFLYEVLPKLPVMSNGIILLGVAETNPLIQCEDVYKLRYVRPDKPIGHSEVWEDCTTVRLTVFGKLISDEMQLTFCRLESASFIPGIQDTDAIGPNALKNVFELHDASNLTIKPFIRRKTTGTFNYKLAMFINYSIELLTIIAEITVARKMKLMRIQELKDGCYTRMGGNCNETDRYSLCQLCLIDGDVAKLRNHFEKRFDENLENSK